MKTSMPAGLTAEPGTAPKSCFVIAPIGEPESEIRKRSDQVLQYVIAKALEPLGYNVLRADKISQPGLITLQVLQRVMEAELVVADLTGHNPNVFYELAVRHAVEKPVIHLIDSTQPIPFDVSDFRTIKLDHRDLASVDHAISEIQRQAKEIEQGAWGETPIKLASVVQRLAAGESQDKVVLGQVLDTLLQIRADMKVLAHEAQEARMRRIYERALVGPSMPRLAGLGGLRWPPSPPPVEAPETPFPGEPPKPPADVTVPPPPPKIEK